MLKYQELINRMTLWEKIRITSGKDTWRLEEFNHLDIPKITLSDGPHGLRYQKEEQDHLGINESQRSTCFPPACLSAASFDEELLYEMGQAIGYEALYEDIQVVLGPGVNIKRNPLCGRNFEYFSEDPYLSSHLASAWIKGLQSTGAGASIKHFALNNQENNRMKSNSITDRKAMHDIYLKSFEKPVREAKPHTVMASYNLVDGLYATENPFLLSDILRGKFGFEGVIITDWAAMNNKTASFQAGLDLEMPGGASYFDEEVVRDIRKGNLDEEVLNKSVDRILDLIFRTKTNQKLVRDKLGEKALDIEKHHALAKKIAQESVILLKNDNRILPLGSNTSERIVVIGALAKEARYQGAGSSHINPYRVTSLLDALNYRNIEYTYYEGYPLKDAALPSESAEEILNDIHEKDIVIYAMGLPESFESEGFDRKHMRLPDVQNELLMKIAQKNSNIIVVLSKGSPVEMPWIDSVSALLDLYLPGQAGGEAAADILFGDVNPSGKLPETYPVKYEDHITSEIYGVENYEVQYREGIYVGYRYFDKAKKEVLFPFGYGLSYTDFSYKNLNISHEATDFIHDKEITVSCTVKNVGGEYGKEITQLYIQKADHEGYMCVKDLKGFKKTALEPGEEKEIRFTLKEEDFIQYDLEDNKEVVYEGEYKILIGSSSRDIHLEHSVQVAGKTSSFKSVPAFYRNLDGKPTLDDFEKLIGKKISDQAVTKPFTLNSTMNEMKDVPQMKIVIRKLNNMLRQAIGAASEQDDEFKVVHSMFMQTPVKRLTLSSPDKMPKYQGEMLVHIANGEFLKAASKFRNRK